MWICWDRPNHSAKKHGAFEFDTNNPKYKRNIDSHFTKDEHKWLMYFLQFLSYSGFYFMFVNGIN